MTALRKTVLEIRYCQESALEKLDGRPAGVSFGGCRGRIHRTHMQRLSRHFHNHLISQFEYSSRVKFVICDFHKADELTKGKTWRG